MSNKNIVSIEDRIPKLKQARKKKANRRLIFYLSIFFFLISIIVYLQSPLSHVKTINVQGNVHSTDEEIINLSEITTKSNIWMVNFDTIEKAIKTNSIVNEVEVNRILPWTISIELTEHNVVGYVKEERKYYPVLANGVSLKQREQDTYNGNSPMLIGFTEDEYLRRMAEELNKLPKNITNLISEIHWEPTDNNKNKIHLFMTDGYMVDGTIRNFSEKMEVYPSIVSQLEPGVDGIIHIGVGVYFESFNDESEETDEAEE
jgi:cell division protein FtsQ